MSLFFLALAAAFFCVEEFRWALQSSYLSGQGMPRFISGSTLSPGELRGLRQRAEQTHDASRLAFVALHWPSDNREEVFRIGEQAVAADRSLTWICYPLAGRFIPQWRDPAAAKQILPLIEKAEAFDPDNAAPILLHADFIRAQDRNWPEGVAMLGVDGKPSPYTVAIASKTEWRSRMDEAFAKPRYDPYHVKRFNLERRVLREEGWARPSLVLGSLFTYHIPSLLNIREFSVFQAIAAASEAEEAGKRDEAIHLAAGVSGFGRKMRQGGGTLIEGLIGNTVELIGTEALLPLLHKAGRTDEAALADLSRSELRRGGAAINREPLARTSSYYWSALLVHFLSLSVIFFSLLTLLLVLYVNAKRWIGPQKRGRFYQVVTIAENYVPVVLFIACVTLYLVYFPFAQNFRWYMNTKDEIHQLEPMISNIYPSATALPVYLYLPIEKPFGDYIGWALAAVLLVALIEGWQEWRLRPQTSPSKSAASG